MPPPEPPKEDVLALILDEVWDLTDAIGDLEVRRERLRDVVLQMCKARGATSFAHPRGALRVERYASYQALNVAALLPLIEKMRWEDRVLQIDGRALHALVAGQPEAASYVRSMARETLHEILVLTPAKRRRGAGEGA